MTFGERVDDVVRLGFTGRQARFLVTVTNHGGICLPRQYTAFAGIVYGQKTRNFFRRLVDEDHATTCRCFHNRATIYRLQGRALCGSDQGWHNSRRPLPPGAVVPRIMLLDVILGRPATTWLRRGQWSDQVVDSAAAGATENAVSAESLAVYGRHRHFLDTLRIGIELDGCPVFLFAVTEQSAASFRSLLRHLRPLLETLPTWRVLLACSRDFERGAVVCEDAARRRLDGCSGNPQSSSVNPAQKVERYLLPYAYSHLIPLSSGHAEPKRWLGRVMNGSDDASSADGQ